MPVNVVFFVDGGIGKNVAATAVARSLAHSYKDVPDARLVVLSGYPDVFEHLPFVHRAFGFFNTLNFYEDYINGKEAVVFKVEPYLDRAYREGQHHLIDAWCDDLRIKNDDLGPELAITETERKHAKAWVGKKPMLLMQAQGGAVPAEPGKPVPKGHTRDMGAEVIAAVVAKFHKDYRMVNVKGLNQPDVPGVENVSFTWRETFALIPFAAKRLFIDSVMQHAAAALKCPAVVLWSGTNPRCLGYELHTNIVADNCPTPCCGRPNSYLFDLGPSGRSWMCPHGEACIEHDPAAVISALEAEDDASTAT
jgi:hypothetical protein